MSDIRRLSPYLVIGLVLAITLEIALALVIFDLFTVGAVPEYHWCDMDGRQALQEGPCDA